MAGEAWQQTKVDEMIRRGVLALSDGYRVRNVELGPVGIPFVRGGDIGDGGINTAVEDHIRPEFTDRVQSKLTRPFDVAFITKGTVGRVGMVRPGQPQSVFAPQVCYSMTDEPYREALWSPLRSIVTERWRYVRTTRPELYDLTQDPHETVNLADQQPDMVLELEAELARLEAMFRHRDGTAVQMTDHERRVLESLGYTAGRGQAPAESVSAAPLKDIKEMIVFRDRYDKASELIRKTQWEPAAEILEAIIRDVPDYYKAMLDLGLCRMFQKRDDDAIVWFSRVLEVHPSNDRAHDMLGFTYLRQQKLQLSMKHFLEVLKVRPDSEHAHLFLGEINLRQGRHILARRHYETVLQVNPGNAAARKALEALQSAPANL